MAKTSWFIGKHSVLVKPRRPFLEIRVDGELLKSKQIPFDPGGVYPLTIGKREVMLHHGGRKSVWGPEIWAEGVRVPPSKTAILRRAAPKDATCKPHPPLLLGSAYRAPSIIPAAKIVCGVCRDPLCKACIAVDGVRCKACFEEAVANLAKRERNEHIALNIFGVVVGVSGGGILFLSGYNPLAAIAASAVIAMLGWAWYSRKKEKETPPRRSPR